MTHKYYILTIFTVLVAVASASWVKHRNLEESGVRDYEEIEKSGELRVIVEDNRMSYFTVQCDSIVECDSLGGLQVKMIEEFGRSHNLPITFIEERDLNKAREMLDNDEVDVLVWHIPVYEDLKEHIAYTIPVFTSRQKLVQRKKSKNKKDTTLFITNQLDLAEKVVYIVPGSIFKQRLEHLQGEIGDTIYLREIPESNDDQLFRMVSDAAIDYSVCDEFVARILQKEYKNVDISTAVSFTQNYSWGVSPKTPVLLDSLNKWLEVYLESKEYNKIYLKYTGVK